MGGVSTAPLPPPAAKKKTGVLGIVFLVLFIGGLIGLAVKFRAIFGSEVGGECTDDNGCKPDAVCISKKCYQACKTDADCKDGWSCGKTTVSKTPSGNAAKGFKLDDVNICFSPEKMAPAKEKQRLADLEAKKQDVSRRVIVLLTTKPPQLSAAEFDAAWNAIPEAERSSLSVNDLAARIVATQKR